MQAAHSCKAGKMSVLQTNLSIAILSIAMVLGVLFRLRIYLENRSLWLDASMLAINIVEKSYAELWGLLDWNQSAPVGFLFASKAIGSIFDYSELSLTLLPCVFGIGALVVFLRLAVDLLGTVTAPLAFIPFSLCSTAIYYSGEFKQYSADLFFSTLILSVAFQILRENYSQRALMQFGLLGIVSVWFSHTATILLAGTGIVLFVIGLHRGMRQATKYLAVIGAVIVLHFTALYIFQVRPATAQYMFAFWAKGFAPVIPVSQDAFGWWGKTALGYLSYPLGFHGYGVWIASMLLSVGVISFGFRLSSRSIIVVLVMPIFILIAFSMAHLYPIVTGRYDIHSRLVLFTIPIAYLLIGLGAKAIAESFSRPWPVTFCLVFLIAYSPIRHMMPWPGFLRQEMRPLVSYLQKNAVEGDVIYVYSRAVPAFMFYTRKKPLSFIRGQVFSFPEVDKEVARLAKKEHGKRIWAVISHDLNMERIIQKVLKDRNGPVFKRVFPGAHLLLSVPRNAEVRSKRGRFDYNSRFSI